MELIAFDFLSPAFSLQPSFHAGEMELNTVAAISMSR